MKTSMITFSARRAALLLASAALLAGSAVHAAPQDDYAQYGGDLGGTRYSTLTQINKGNVGKLAKAW